MGNHQYDCASVGLNVKLKHCFYMSSEPHLFCVATASVTVCYSAVSSMPMCKKVEFTVNHTALAQPNQAKVLSLPVLEYKACTVSRSVIAQSFTLSVFVCDFYSSPW